MIYISLDSIAPAVQGPLKKGITAFCIWHILDRVAALWAHEVAGLVRAANKRLDIDNVFGLIVSVLAGGRHCQSSFRGYEKQWLHLASQAKTSNSKLRTSNPSSHSIFPISSHFFIRMNEMSESPMASWDSPAFGYVDIFRSETFFSPRCGVKFWGEGNSDLVLVWEMCSKALFILRSNLLLRLPKNVLSASR